jgi:branched-chain amino acid transport system permease protein
VEAIVQNVVNALSLGGTYAMLALGLTLVFTVLRLVNFAHGELITITGYVLVLGLGLGLPTPLALILAVASSGVAALAMERAVFRPFRGADPLMLLLTSFALSIALQVLFQGLISTRAKGIYLDLGVPVTITIGNVQVDGLKLLTAVVALIALASMSIFLRATTLGLGMRAAAENFPVTRLMGIRANRVIAVAFLISGLLAGIAGVLWVAQRGSVDPLMGMAPLLKAFVAAILGGLGSLGGSAAAGLLLGALEVGFQTYLPAAAVGYRDVMVWIVLIVVLVLRPQGLFGRVSERV